MKYLAGFLATLAFCLMLAPASFAETEINGDASVIGFVAGAQTATAAGFLSKAENNTGAIRDGVTIGGDADIIGFVAGAQTATAGGFLSKAENNVGVIGD